MVSVEAYFMGTSAKKNSVLGQAFVSVLQYFRHLWEKKCTLLNIDKKEAYYNLLS